MVNEELEYLTTEEILQKEWNYYKKTAGKLSGYSSKNEIVKFFQQDNFFIIEKELWRDSSIKEKLLKNRIKYLNKSEEELTDNDILVGFKKSGIYYGYSHFNPLIFKWFIEKYNVKKCFDPCGGWGHRLIAAQCLDLYIYNDLSYNTVCACQDIANYFEMDNVEWYNEDAKDCWPAYQFEFDCDMTGGCSGGAVIKTSNNLEELKEALFTESENYILYHELNGVIQEKLIKEAERLNEEKTLNDNQLEKVKKIIESGEYSIINDIIFCENNEDIEKILQDRC